MRITTLSLLIIVMALLVSCQTADTPTEGYRYVPIVTGYDTNFYALPIKDHLNARDSFYVAMAVSQFKAFDEPNLSLRPQTEPVFRFYYEGFAQKPVFITLLADRIVIKEGSQSIVEEEDQGLPQMSDEERQHYYLLGRRFPVTDTTHSPQTRKYLDSMIRLYPQLRDPKYYAGLLRKSTTPTDPPFFYTIKTINITGAKYKELIDGFDRAGYWTMPPKSSCESATTDGYGFILEANMPAKYNWVNVYGCPGDTSAFTIACQQLINSAGMGAQLNLIGK